MPIAPLPTSRRALSRLAFAAALLVGTAAAAAPSWSEVAQAADPPASSSTSKSGASASQNDDPPYRVSGTDGEGLRIRKDAGLDGKIVARLPEGALVRRRDEKMVDEDGVRWMAVSSTEGKGWAAAKYLERVKTPTIAAPTHAPDAPFADRVVAIARSAHGQPYVWAGNAPGGFDCSGFVQWVYTRAGLEMPRTIPDQLASGKKVDRDALRPGDLLSFVNTYAEGLSHVGIYLGDDRFEHASDEAHGVTVSSLKEPYWEERFHRAVRPR